MGPALVHQAETEDEEGRLGQCPYGAETPKPTGILTNAEWMWGVSKRRAEVREHEHMPGAWWAGLA